MELPVLRLGMAGFSPEQEHALETAARASRNSVWIAGPLAGADAWMINGARTQKLEHGRLRIAAARTGDRALQLELSDVRCPVAFSTPLPKSMEAMCTFDVAQPAAIGEVLRVFEMWLARMQAQFWLAAHIVEHQEVLGSATFELRSRGQLIAVVDMRGDVAVLPSVRPANFEVAVWTRLQRERLLVPDHFCRTSLADLMWRYVSRSRRGLLPERFRRGLIYFRRPPRVERAVVGEEHLLAMRELAIHPCRYDELLRDLGLTDEELGRTLAALYYVGSITGNPQRAAATTVRGELGARGGAGGINSNYGIPRTANMPLELLDLRHLTAPAPLMPA